MLIKIISTVALLTAAFLASAYAQQDDDILARDLEVLQRPPWPPRQGCVEPKTFFNSNVVVTFEGSPSTLDANTYMQLEDAFMEAYNELRKGLCDDESRKVMDVEVDQESLDTKEGLNEFSLLFQVRVGCDLCSTSDTTLFEMEPDTRRELAVYTRKYHAMIHGGMVAPTSKPTPEPSQSPVNTASVRDDTDECCPPNAPARAPYGSEFAEAYNATYNAIGIQNRRLQENPIESVVKAIEVSPISCEDPLEPFETTVLVEFGGTSEDAVDSEIFALEASFQTSYNGFGEEVVCDPLFRIITEVQTEEVDEFDERYLRKEERKLQGTKRFNYRVKGRCRGCSGNPRLFAQGSSGRRHRRQLEMAYSRQLQFVFDEGQCFCAVGAEERGVFQDEFTVVYDENIQELRDEGIVETVDTVEVVEEDPPWTWSPTTSPTNFPTGPTDSPVPSPSPSRIPSASPTEG